MSKKKTCDKCKNFDDKVHYCITSSYINHINGETLYNYKNTEDNLFLNCARYEERSLLKRISTSSAFIITMMIIGLLLFHFALIVLLLPKTY